MNKSAEKTLAIHHIPVEKLTPNDWNPNRMSDEMRAKLKAYVEREGFVEPIVVRPHRDGYQILGGYHRWGISRDLGYETVPCVVVELDDRRAKILSINLNEMKGRSVPNLLANLVHELSGELTLKDLESQLPYSVSELKDSLELLKIPDGLESYLDEEAAKQGRERPTILSFVVEDAETVEEAIAKAGSATGSNRGAALVEISRSYLAAAGEKGTDVKE